MAAGSKRAVQNTLIGPKAVEETAPAQHVIVDNQSLRRLYGIVVRCRLVAQRVAGWSAMAATAQAAAIIELNAEDAVALSGESLPLQLWAGAPLERALVANGSAAAVAPDGTRPKMIPATGVGASQLSIAAGVALASKFADKRAVVVALMNTESMTLGPSYEALNYAAAHKLPLIVVVDNRAGDKVHPELMLRAQAHGMPGFVVDGNDAVAVYRVAREAIHRARAGRGPSLLECREFIIPEDPLRHLERYLEKHGLWTARLKREITAEAERELRRAKRTRPSR